jgi:hypothetical protein
MYTKLCAFIFLSQILGTAAFAVDEKKLSGPHPLNPFQGTPEEQASLCAGCDKFLQGRHPRHVPRSCLLEREPAAHPEGLPESAGRSRPIA